MTKDRIFYLHIPKTAGTSMNTFLSSKFDDKEVLTHLESNKILNAANFAKKTEKYKYISGHVVLPRMIRDLDVFNTMTTVATFRRPIEHVVSHISWVRKLGDPGQEKKLGKHTPEIKRIVNKLLEIDLSNPDDITIFIEWLEEKELYLFHNTQTKYLCGGAPGVFTPQMINTALIHLNKIDFVGTVERLNDFYLLLAGSLSLKVEKDELVKENANGCNFGLDISDTKISKVLQHLVDWDNLIYRIAKEKFIDDLHGFLIDFEKNQSLKFSSVKHNIIKKL